MPSWSDAQFSDGQDPGTRSARSTHQARRTRSGETGLLDLTSTDDFTAMRALFLVPGVRNSGEQLPIKHYYRLVGRIPDPSRRPIALQKRQPIL